MEDWSGIIAAAVIGALIWGFSDHPLGSTFTGKRNVYPVVCQKDTEWLQTRNSLVGVSCPSGSKTTALARRTFRTFSERQAVTEVVQYSSFSISDRFDNCVVFDADNWSCKYPTGSGDAGKTVGMADGDFSNEALPNAVFVSKITWHWYRWTEQLR